MANALSYSEDIVVPNAAFGGGPIILKRVCTPGAAFGGGTLRGSELVRFVFVDEAGITKEEDVSVVVGLILEADRHVRRAEEALQRLLVHVPAQHKKGFRFHVQDLLGTKYKSDWSFKDRIALVKELVALPRSLGIPVACGAVRRERLDTPRTMTTMNKIQTDHFGAYIYCLAAADKHIRYHGAESEIGQVVAEDTQEMHDHLKSASRRLAELQLQPNHSYHENFAVERLRANAYFVGKKDEPMLQIADACVYGLKRYLCNDSHGDDYMMSLRGSLPERDYRANIMLSCVFLSPSQP